MRQPYWAYSLPPSPCAATAVISSPHLISLPEKDHTHRHHHRLVSFQGLWRFFPATISCSISVWLFSCPPPLCASIMPLFALIMCPLGVGAASGSLMPLSAFAARLPFCHFSSVDFAKIHQRQWERERGRGRKIFATSQSCLVVSSPGPM